YLIIILISAFASAAFSQQKSNYSLLWRISGKGLSKPSYLFATMHVKDKRVFNFSDSVMLSLQSCQRFAMEVHPDTLMIKMFASLQNPDSLRSLDKMLGKADYEKLAKKFKDKNGYDIGKTDPMVLESLMKPADNKPGDKVSFIDAYLYGMARTLNKNVLGLEDVASQFDQYYGSKDAIKERLLDLLDDDVEAAKDESKEEMIKIYSSGNLDDIYSYVLSMGMNDSTIVARNKVMAASMIKYMADGTLFTAVGAAHLPGPDGVIALLRKEGYTVTKVKADFTGVADKFQIDYMKMDWPVYRDNNNGYSVNFPGTPIKFAMSGINTLIYADLANDLYYGIYAVPRGTAAVAANRQQVINTFFDNISKSKKSQLVSRKDFVFNKMQCTELVLKGATGYTRTRLILANNMLYAFYAGSRVNNLDLPYVNRYLNSFVSLPVVQKAPPSWITYTNTAGAFTVKMPGEPKNVSKQIPAVISGKNVTYSLNMYVSTDSVNSASYLVRYNDYPPGTYLSDKEKLFSTMLTEFKDKGKIIAGPVKITTDGLEGEEIAIVLNGGYNAKIRTYVKGNRVYLLLSEILQPDLKADGNSVFFDSLHFTPCTEPTYYTFHPDSSNYTVKMVAKPFELPDSTKTLQYTNFVKNITTWYSTNPNSGGLFGFEHSTISPYYRAKNIDSLYSALLVKVSDSQDTVLKTDTILLDGIKGRELLVQKTGTDAKRRIRVVVKDNDIFWFIGRMDNSELFDKSANTFYSSLTTTPSNTAPVDLAASKAGKIFKDLQSNDTTVYKNALGALSYYDFTADELPAVYAALQKNYPDDTLQNGARRKLIKGLQTLNNDSTISVLVKLYPTLKQKDDLKAAILDAIPRIDQKTGYDTYLNLLTSDPPLKPRNTNEVFNALSDSIEFAAAHFTQVLPLISNPAYRNNLLRIARFIAVKKNSVYDKMLKDNYAAIMANAAADIDNYLKLRDSTDNEWSGSVYNYMQLIGKIKNGDLNDKLTKRYIETDPKGLYAPDAITARVYNNLSNNQLLVNKYLDSIGTRYDLMEAFNSQKQLDRVPLKYRTQAAYAKLCLYQSVSADDYGSPKKITLLGSIIKNGSVYYAFKFSLPDRDEKEELIALTGPYKPGATKLNFERYYAYTDYEVVKTNWRLQAGKMIQALIDAYKDPVK
ncbi:MAG: TraB/GumN family protein, partial [Mucilaginibacter sp.]